jgi:hypothetical protein
LSNGFSSDLEPEELWTLIRIFKCFGLWPELNDPVPVVLVELMVFLEFTSERCIINLRNLVRQDWAIRIVACEVVRDVVPVSFRSLEPDWQSQYMLVKSRVVECGLVDSAQNFVSTNSDSVIDRESLFNFSFSFNDSSQVHPVKDCFSIQKGH